MDRETPSPETIETLPASLQPARPRDKILGVILGLTAAAIVAAVTVYFTT